MAAPASGSGNDRPTIAEQLMHARHLGDKYWEVSQASWEAEERSGHDCAPLELKLTITKTEMVTPKYEVVAIALYLVEGRDANGQLVTSSWKRYSDFENLRKMCKRNSSKSLYTDVFDKLPTKWPSLLVNTTKPEFVAKRMNELNVLLASISANRTYRPPIRQLLRDFAYERNGLTAEETLKQGIAERKVLEQKAKMPSPPPAQPYSQPAQPGPGGYAQSQPPPSASSYPAQSYPAQAYSGGAPAPVTASAPPSAGPPAQAYPVQSYTSGPEQPPPSAGPAAYPVQSYASGTTAEPTPVVTPYQPSAPPVEAQQPPQQPPQPQPAYAPIPPVQPPQAAPQQQPAYPPVEQYPAQPQPAYAPLPQQQYPPQQQQPEAQQQPAYPPQQQYPVQPAYAASPPQPQQYPAQPQALPYASPMPLPQQPDQQSQGQPAPLGYASAAPPPSYGAPMPTPLPEQPPPQPQPQPMQFQPVQQQQQAGFGGGLAGLMGLANMMGGMRMGGGAGGGQMTFNMGGGVGGGGPLVLGGGAQQPQQQQQAYGGGGAVGSDPEAQRRQGIAMEVLDRLSSAVGWAFANPALGGRGFYEHWSFSIRTMMAERRSQFVGKMKEYYRITSPEVNLKAGTITLTLEPQSNAFANSFFGPPEVIGRTIVIDIPEPSQNHGLSADAGANTLLGGGGMGGATMPTRTLKVRFQDGRFYMSKSTLVQINIAQAAEIEALYNTPNQERTYVEGLPPPPVAYFGKGS